MRGLSYNHLPENNHDLRQQHYSWCHYRHHLLGRFHGSILLMLPIAHKETPLQPDVTSKGKKRGFALELHSQDVSVLSQIIVNNIWSVSWTITQQQRVFS